MIASDSNISYSKVSLFNDDNTNRIDNFVSEYNGTPFHEIEFNTILSSVYNTKFHFLVAEINGNMVGVCPIHEINNGVLKQLYSSIYTSEIPYGGWIFNPEKVTLESLINSLKINFRSKLMYSSNIQNIDDNYSKSSIRNLKVHNTLILDLTPSIEDIFSFLKSKQRGKIRRAEKMGITLEEIPYANIEKFYALSNELKDRVGLKIKPKVLYSKTLEAFAAKGRGTCLGVKYQGEIVSSMILITNKNYAIAWVNGRKGNLPNNLYQNELLLWKCIEWAKENGSHYFDFCGIDVVNLPHLARGKLSFSKEIVPFYTLSRSNIFYKGINFVQRFFKRLNFKN